LKKVQLKLHLPLICNCFLKTYIYVYVVYGTAKISTSPCSISAAEISDFEAWPQMCRFAREFFSECRHLAGCPFSHMGKEKLLKLVMRSHVVFFIFVFTENYGVWFRF